MNNVGTPVKNIFSNAALRMLNACGRFVWNFTQGFGIKIRRTNGSVVVSLDEGAILGDVAGKEPWAVYIDDHHTLEEAENAATRRKRTGKSMKAAREDHVHPVLITSDTPKKDSGEGSIGSVNGSRVVLAIADHVHPLNIGTTQDTYAAGNHTHSNEYASASIEKTVSTHGIDIMELQTALEILEGEVDTNLPTIENVANKAQTTAESAKTTAESAQTTAESAKTTAESAQTTAESAQTTAESAQTTAESAQTTAESAQTTAESAQSTAESAQSTANKAQSTASAAKTTAESAKTTAESAQSTASAAQSAASSAASAAAAAGSRADEAMAKATSLESTLNEAVEALEKSIEEETQQTDEAIANISSRTSALEEGALTQEDIDRAISVFSTSTFEPALKAKIEASALAPYAKTANVEAKFATKQSLEDLSDAIEETLSTDYVNQNQIGQEGGVQPYSERLSTLSQKIDASGNVPLSSVKGDIGGHGGTCFATVLPDGTISHSGNNAYNLLAGADNAGATNLLTDLDLSEEDLENFATVSGEFISNGVPVIPDSLVEDSSDNLQPAGNEASVGASGKLVYSDHVHPAEGVKEPASTTPFGSGQAAGATAFSKSHTFGKPSGVGAEILIATRGAGIGDGENGRIWFRPFVISGDGRIYAIGSEAQAFGVYMATA